MKTRIHVVQGDITKLAVDVIVNAANPSLMGGGGKQLYVSGFSCNQYWGLWLPSCGSG